MFSVQKKIIIEWVAIVLVILFGGQWIIGKVHTQDPASGHRLPAQKPDPTAPPEKNSTPPHFLWDLPDGAKVFEAMDKGCEIYIVESYNTERSHETAMAGERTHANSLVVAITTGKGCQGEVQH